AKNAMEIFKVLERSNCRECGEKTCLAFAGAVFCGTRRINECPKLNSATLAQFASTGDEQLGQESDLEIYIAELKKQAIQLDFSLAATRIGAQADDDVLRVKILGKYFGISKNGSFRTDLHLIPWIVIPLLQYVLNCKGMQVSGQWVSYRELPGGKEKYALFKKRGEDVLQQLADKYTDFFDDVLHMFDGRAVDKQFEADVSVVLKPLPLVPIMICYWKPDEGLASSLNIFFDKSAGDNIGADSAFSLGTGLVQMLEKLATHHGF
ncbi:MAG: DUF3786 domain-containing protein, partial [Proteobacteria bacterium]|nr:DUF3786 domain-containing protein [Pseudomonadota bacterium]